MQIEKYVTDKLQSDTLLMMLVSIVLTFPIFILLLRQDSKKQQKMTGIITYERTTLVQYILIVFLAIAYCMGANKLIDISHIIDIFPGYKEVVGLFNASGIAMQLLVIGVAAPVIEELLFRGLVYRRMREYCKMEVALLLSGIIFGIYHFNVVQGIYAAFMGILLAYLYEKFHTLWAPIVCHSVANIMSTLVMEIGVLKKLSENTISSFIIMVLSILILIIILKRLRKIKQQYTVVLPEASVQSEERSSLQ